jgi:hypothetical protein
MVHKVLGVAFSLIVLGTPASAFEVLPDGSVKVGSFWDITTCGQYAADRRLPPNTGRNGFDKEYIAGWLSAYNALVSGHNIGGGDAQLDNTLLWLDRFCLDHPFETMQDGLVEFNFKIAPHLHD